MAEIRSGRRRRPRPGPRRCARAAASTRRATPSLARMFETCTLAVLRVMNSCSAIWRLEQPVGDQAQHLALAGGQPSCRTALSSAGRRRRRGGPRRRRLVHRSRARRTSASISSRSGAAPMSRASLSASRAAADADSRIAVGRQRLGVAQQRVGQRERLVHLPAGPHRLRPGLDLALAASAGVLGARRAPGARGRRRWSRPCDSASSRSAASGACASSACPRRRRAPPAPARPRSGRPARSAASCSAAPRRCRSARAPVDDLARACLGRRPSAPARPRRQASGSAN